MTQLHFQLHPANATSPLLTAASVKPIHFKLMTVYPVAGTSYAPA